MQDELLAQVATTHPPAASHRDAARAAVPAAVRSAARSGAGVSAVLWGALYTLAAFTGQRFSTVTVATDWQFAPLDALSAHPLRSVWYLHVQPPLWNLVVGVLGRWSPFSLALSLQLVMLASGMVLAGSIASLLRAMGLGRRWVVVVTLVATANTGVLMYGFLPLYELPVAALLALTVCLATRRSTRMHAVVAVSLVGTAVAMTRSLYHPTWFVLVLALVMWTHRSSLSRRVIMAAVLVPLVVIGGWSLKNQVLFGESSLSSWSGMNLLRSVEPAIAPTELAALREDGTISDVAVVGHFEPYSRYESVMPPCSPTHRDVVLTEALRYPAPTAGNPEPLPSPNFNYECFLPVFDQAGSDALALIRARPGAWFTARLWAINNWFCAPTEREPSNSAVVDALNKVSSVALVAVAHPTTPSSWKAYPGLMSPHRTPISLVLIIATFVVMVAGTRHLWRLLRSKADNAARSLVIALAAVITGWTFVVGVVGELGEQERFRNMTDPIVIAVAAAIVIQWWVGRGPSRLRQRLRPTTTVPVAALVLIAGLVIVGVRQGPPAQSVIAAAAAGQPTLASLASGSPTTVGSSDDNPPSGIGFFDTSTDAPPPSTEAPATTTTVAMPAPACHHIVHLGDSNLGLSLGMFRDVYARAGLDPVLDFANGRGATQAADGGSSAVQAVAQHQHDVPTDRRCWVVALSDVDAMESARDNIDPATSIQLIADAIGGEPTTWVTPVLASATSAWTLQASTAYNLALLRVASEHPNITVVDWQDEALQHLDMFLSDGIHYQAPMYLLLTHAVITHLAAVWDLQQ
ncbi:unannotated protein [freshwater metagenome]|uniref:Unannotated protein n=1 Tax=freshwater metagenome TaxID=449393 RepID=A0A6J7EKC0_9ZZZZ|nr:hypothetical protein [Actinomycetota bacterium]